MLRRCRARCAETLSAVGPEIVRALPPEQRRAFREEQARWVGDRLDALREAAADRSLRGRLDEIATARARLWFG